MKVSDIKKVACVVIHKYIKCILVCKISYVSYILR